MRMELSDLPPRMRAQAMKQIAEQEKATMNAMRLKEAYEKAVERTEREKAAQAAGTGDFDSRGEYEYYISEIVPKLHRGEVKKCLKHPVFQLFAAGEYGGIELGAIRYTADFRLDYADGTVEIVEVKSRFVRRMQRDYPLRRRVFIEQIARPSGWKFTEVITGESKDEAAEWKKQGAKITGGEK